MMMRSAFMALAVICLPAIAQTSSMTDEEVKARTEEIGRTLRCVVCQNQSIADSDATLAEDMRRLVETRVRAGDTDEEVRAFFQKNYGDFVLMEPPVKSSTWLLWFGPLIIVLAGLGWYVTAVRKTSASTSDEDAELSPDERARLTQIMSEAEPKK